MTPEQEKIAQLEVELNAMRFEFNEMKAGFSFPKEIEDAIRDRLGLTSGGSGLLGVPFGGTGAATLTGLLKGNGTSAFSAVVPLGGTKVYYVSDTSGGAVTRKLTFTDGVLVAET